MHTHLHNVPEIFLGFKHEYASLSLKIILVCSSLNLLNSEEFILVISKKGKVVLGRPDNVMALFSLSFSPSWAQL